jgi:nucleoside-diphosphate-sugar epimerase
MRVCVVGGTGNISLSIARLLLRQGHDVTCFNRGVSPGLPEGARLIRGDRTDQAAFEQVMQREKFDAAIDMLCFNPEQAASDVRAFRACGHFVVCSTVITYGQPIEWMPVTEDHPLRPDDTYGRNKAAADAVFLEARARDGFPVTILKPSTTYGPKQGLIRQIGGGFAWLDRIRKGKPLLVYGDGLAAHQFLHVDDAALCFAGALGKRHCIGQIYNVVRRGFTTWHAYHRVAMRLIGREVEQVGVPFEALHAAAPARFRGAFARDSYFSAEKVCRDVPEFHPRIALEDGMAGVLADMDREGRIPDSDLETSEDKIIEAQRNVGAAIRAAVMAEGTRPKTSG